MSFMGNEFSGLPIADLIGGPLTAACDAQVRLAKATSDFITSVGFNPELDAGGKPTGKLVPRNVDFSFWQPLPFDKVLAASEVLAKGTVTLSGGLGGSLDSITVKGAEILGSAIAFDTDLATTASKVVAQINQYPSIPRYTASANGAVITITAPPGSGASLNAAVVTPTVTAGPNAFAAASTNLAGGHDAPGGVTQVQKVVLSVPFLAVVNVPALMVKSVDIVFDMEVKASETHHDAETKEAALDATAKVGWGPFSAEVKIHGAVSAHQENTRSTDRSAKYHVQVHASDDGMPEGLSRVLDILQKAIAPVSVGRGTDLATAAVAKNAM